MMLRMYDKKAMGKIEYNQPVIASKWINSRDVKIDTVLGPGEYIIIPATYDQAASPSRVVNYALSVYFDCPKDQIILERAKLQNDTSSLKDPAQPIQEEEEESIKFDEEFKKIIMVKSASLIPEV